MEEWRDVKGYEGLYEVSSLGRFKSLEREVWDCRGYYRLIKERISKGSVYNTGYVMVKLSQDGEYITKSMHQLVAIAFLNHTICGMELVVNHKNFNKLDNRVENLEVVTARENSNRKHLKSTSKYVGVYLHKATQKWGASIVINGKSRHLGLFNDEIQANIAYQSKLKTMTI